MNAMNAQERIRKALKSLMSDGEANACQVFKGYNMGTGKTGWHFARFGQSATFIGNNLVEALEWIEVEEDQRRNF